MNLNPGDREKPYEGTVRIIDGVNDNKYRCTECDVIFAGHNRFHCGTCHRTFNSEYAHEKHKEGKYDYNGRLRVDMRVCKSSQELIEKYSIHERDGVWYTARRAEFPFD